MSVAASCNCSVVCDIQFVDNNVTSHCFIIINGYVQLMSCQTKVDMTMHCVSARVFYSYSLEEYKMLYYMSPER